MTALRANIGESVIAVRLSPRVTEERLRRWQADAVMSLAGKLDRAAWLLDDWIPTRTAGYREFQELARSLEKRRHNGEDDSRDWLAIGDAATLIRFMRLKYQPGDYVISLRGLTVTAERAPHNGEGLGSEITVTAAPRADDLRFRWNRRCPTDESLRLIHDVVTASSQALDATVGDVALEFAMEVSVAREARA